MASSQKELHDSITKCAAEVREKHGLLERKVANRACRRLEYLITHHRPLGRPPEERVTKATEIFERQRLKGKGCRVNWNEIAQRCIPGYDEFSRVI